MNHKETAEEIYNLKENIILVYAFNGTGKTRLSVAYKDISKEKNDNNHSGVYYNAFSEDLFVWDNDEPNDNDNIVLNVNESTLNKFHGSLTEELVYAMLAPYKPKYDFYFNTYENPEKGIESISFYVKGDDKTRIKISRGEERIFVWCFFLTLFEVEGWADEQNTHFFIDDPVSSLDDHNIFITAATVFNLIEEQFEERKIIITSHHFGFLTILSNWLSKGEKASKFRNRDKSKKFKEYIMKNDSESLSLIKPNNGVFLYHLRLLQILDEAYKNEIFAYHFALLRQVIENIGSFLGAGHFGYTLNRIGITDETRVAEIINALTHKNVYYYESDLVVDDNKKIFNEVYEGLIKTYGFITKTQ